MENQLWRTKEIPLVMAISIVGRTITGTHPYISSSDIYENLLVSGRAGFIAKVDFLARIIFMFLRRRR